MAEEKEKGQKREEDLQVSAKDADKVKGGMYPIQDGGTSTRRPQVHKHRPTHKKN